jgi:hypothetical protein
MGSTYSVPNGTSFVAAMLAQSSSSSKNDPNSQNLGTILQSASPSDAVALSDAAIQLQQVDGIFGLPAPESPPSPVTSPSPPSQSWAAVPQDNSLGAPAPIDSATLAQGILSSDLSNATPDQLSAIAAQVQALQQHASLFAPAPNYQANLNVLG